MTKDYQEPFPDLKVQIVKEIVNTGGTIDADDIPIYTGKEISPEDFHLILTQARANGGWVAESEAGTATVTTTKKKVVLIDVRNTFEHAIGHFVHPHSNNIIPIEGDNTPANVLGEKNESSKNNTSTSEPTPAINPNTVTFSHFDSNFCSKYTDVLKDKKVLMVRITD
jgi:predicted sulfurtransferase